MPDERMQIADNLARVNARVDAACRRAGRPRHSVTLVAVTKYARVEWVRVLIELGVRQLGESRPQQLVERAALFGPEIEWHLIGTLQRNKARRVLPIARLIHAVDSLKLLDALDRMAGEEQRRSRVLLEVNLTGEATKHGFSREELLSQWPEVCRAEHVEVAGLMTMAAETEDPEGARPTFAALRQLRDELAPQSAGAHSLTELSMGMTGDYEVAIEEGATFIRIGSALFEGLEA
jgi:pyridoxal phosphate enzyme (YggS family)